MEAELDRRANAPRASAPEDLPGKDEALRVVTSAARCPFCHAQVAPEAQEWVACEGCLARHHASCWRDNGSCSSCGGKKQLVPAPAHAKVGRAPRLAAVALAVAVAANLLVAVSVWRTTAREGELEKRIAELEARAARPPAAAGSLAPVAPKTPASEVDVAKARALEASVRADLKPFADGKTRSLIKTDTIGVQRRHFAESLSGSLVEVAAAYEKLGLKDDVRRVLAANDVLLKPSRPVADVLAILEGGPH